MSGYIGNIPVPQATQTRDNFTATDGQTTFSTSGYTPSYLDVYLNGIHLDPSDYTATNGTDVVLASGASAGDVVTVVAYQAFEVADQAFSGDFSVDGSTFVVDSANDKVGIGTSSPASQLYLNKGGASSGDQGPEIILARDSLSGASLTVGDVLNTLKFQTNNSNRFWAIQQLSGSATTNSELAFVRHNDSGQEEVMRLDVNGRLGIGTDSPDSLLSVALPSATGTYFEGGGTGSSSELRRLLITASTTTSVGDTHTLNAESANGNIAFATTNTERARIDSSGNLLVGTTNTNPAPNNAQGTVIEANGKVNANVGATLHRFGRTNDGTLMGFYSAGNLEGSISISGSTVSYNGGHLARWSQLTDGTKDESIVKGTVLTNLDQMAVWHHEAVEAQDAVYDDEGNIVTEAVEAKEAYTEDNEQLNCMAVSSVEGDPNVAGVFVNWDLDDDEFNDMNIAMTGDMVIRIAQGTTVARGDLLMSAGDGTAKPQGDDIVRSKTIAKVTSTNVSHTYDDGSYLVPCVLMAC